MEVEELLKKEMKMCWKYFYENTSLDKSSSFFGLTRDKYPLAESVAGISATGYGLASIIIAIENNWLEYDEGYLMAYKTLETLLRIENKHGFYYRYLDMNTGKREWNSEISIIDTGILLCGVLLVGEYFGEEVRELANKIYSRVNWNWFVDKQKKQFRLGYKPDRGFYGYWDNYAEQLILYVLGAGSPTHPVYDLYEHFERKVKDDIIYSWFGCLFTYQYSHAWLDFRDLYDRDNVNWYENSVKATMANIDYCSQHKIYKGYWGASATITKKRYSQRLGAEPCVDKIRVDGTVSLSAMISSIVFVPEETKESLERLYKKCPETFGEYGFVTSIKRPWISEEYLGLDKGTTMLMLANYFDGVIWEIFRNNEYVKKGLSEIGIKKEQ